MGILDAPSLSKNQADNLYVPKVTGKGLSANDYTDVDKLQVAVVGNVITGVSKNLFNINASGVIPNAFMDTAGNVSYGQSSFGVSDYMPVTPGLTYTGRDINTGGMRFTTYFDATKAVVTGGSNATVTTFTVPTTGTPIAFVRITYVVGVSPNLFQFELGSTPTTWVPYTQKIAPAYPIVAEGASFLQRSVNLFNKAVANDGFFVDNNGNRSASATNGYSDYIAVKPGQRYAAWNNFDASPIRMHCYYDKDYNVVAGGSTTATGSITVPITSTPIAYVRVTYNVGTTGNVPIGKNSFQFQLGASATTYKPFSYTFTSSVLSTWNMPVWGAEKLKRFKVWAKMQDYRFDWLVFGDSYVDGNYWTQLLFNSLLLKGGFTYGGSGYLSFSNADGPLNSNSINPAKFSSTWVTGDWNNNGPGTTIGTSWAPGAVDIISLTNTATVTVTVSEALDTIDLLYKLQSGGGSFRYKIDAGSWTTISTASGSTSITALTINTSTLGASFTITIQALATGISLGGMIARKIGNLLNVHKVGLTGSTAAKFGQGAGFSTAINYLTPQGCIFTWGTNEINGNILPSSMKANIQNLVNVVRTINPTCDLLFINPPQQQYGTEQVRTYVNQDYADAMFQLAQENGGCFMDMAQVFGPFSQTLIDAGFMNSDRVHLGAKGGVLYEESITNVMLYK